MSDLSIVKCDAKSEDTDVEYYNKELLIFFNLFLTMSEKLFH